MFRRRNRQQRRFARRAFRALFNPQGQLAAEARQAFDEANELYANGEYAEAAEQFAELADAAQSFNRPRRVAQLRLRAYDAWLKAKQPANALQQARTVLTGVVAAGRVRAAGRIARQVLDDLRAAGYMAEAEAFAKEVAGQGAPLTQSAAVEQRDESESRQLKFPVACPQCGGRLPRSFGEDEIECDYCGSIIRAE